jgi:large subunit ribosomal protein L1
MGKNRSKRYRQAQASIQKDKFYSLEEAITKLKEIASAKFDETVDMDFRLAANPKHSDQMVRGAVVLPHGTGKKIRILAFCKGEQEQDARQAGADFVGGQDLINKINSGWLDFDVVVAGPDMMKEVARLGKILGPRGLMPSPKAGTVTNDIAKAIREIKSGKIEFRIDKQGIVHSSIGKVSFDASGLIANAKALCEAIVKARPPAVKGKFIKSVSVSTTMGPALKIDVTKLS